jgi:hypothetical protein
MAKVLVGARAEEDTVLKLKYIAWQSRRSYATTVEIALEEHVLEWEKKNGPITAKLIEDAKIK